MLKGTRITYTEYDRIIGILLQRIGQRALRVTLDELALAPKAIRRADPKGNFYFGLDMSSMLDLDKEEEMKEEEETK